MFFVIFGQKDGKFLLKFDMCGISKKRFEFSANCLGLLESSFKLIFATFTFPISALKAEMSMPMCGCPIYWLGLRLYHSHKKGQV